MEGLQTRQDQWKSTLSARKEKVRQSTALFVKGKDTGLPSATKIRTGRTTTLARLRAKEILKDQRTTPAVRTTTKAKAAQRTTSRRANSGTKARLARAKAKEYED